MEDVDFARAWLRLKAEIAKKRSHGQEGLLAEMSRIEVECSRAYRTAHEGSQPPEAADEAASEDRPGPAEPTTATEEADHGSRNGSTPEPAGVA